MRSPSLGATALTTILTDVITAEIVEDEENLFDSAETIPQVLGELAGYASSCWYDSLVEEGKYGRPNRYEKVFDSEKAAMAIDDAHVRIKQLIIQSIQEDL